MRHIPKIAAWLGVALLLTGTGAADYDNIPFGWAVLMMIIGVILLGGGILVREVNDRANVEETRIEHLSGTARRDH